MRGGVSQPDPGERRLLRFRVVCYGLKKNGSCVWMYLSACSTMTVLLRPSLRGMVTD